MLLATTPPLRLASLVTSLVASLAAPHLPTPPRFLTPQTSPPSRLVSLRSSQSVGHHHGG